MKTILFIEDEPALQKALKDALEQEGFAMVQGFNGEEGLELAQSENIDLILLDIVLPKKNGFSILEELKKNEKTAHIPVIILTNLETSQDIEKALSLGADTYLVKANYGPDDVIKKVRETLNRP